MPKTAGTTFGDPRQYPYLSVGTTSTHDMSPLRSWWCEDTAPSRSVISPRCCTAAESLPPSVRLRCAGRSSAARSTGSRCWPYCRCRTGWLRTAVCGATIPTRKRINRPDDPNNYWRYRMHLTIEELLASAEFNRSIKRMLRTSDRTDKP